MNFNIVDTQAAYQRLLAAPDAATRETIFREELAAPYAGLAQIFGGGDSLATFRQWGMSPDQFADGSRDEMAAILEELAAHDAWNRAARALEEGRAAFAAFEERIPLGLIQFGLFVAELKGVPMQRGYTGFGGVPGYIITVYGEPDEYNLVRIEGATVHELHHNVRFTLFPFTMQVTLGEYIIAEGLAESFAAELYGEEVVGFYVTDFNEAELEQAKRVIGGALDASGFDVVRGYIFGDALAEHFGLPKAGVPAFAGYAIGYRVVQQYLKRTGKSVAEATFVPAQELITESGFFD